MHSGKLCRMTKMKFYLAPMEGLTGFVFRNAYQKHFGNIDTYFTPFINNKKMNYKEIKDILPEHNEGMHVVPTDSDESCRRFSGNRKRVRKLWLRERQFKSGVPVRDGRGKAPRRRISCGARRNWITF